MNGFEFYNKTKVVFGKDAVEQLGKLTASQGKKVLLHYGGGSIKKSGLYEDVISQLDKENIRYIELSGVKPNPRLSLVQEGIELCRKEHVDFVLAVGGGSVIDSAKAIAAGVNYKGNVWDFYLGTAAPETCLPLGVVLTIPAAGSETSSSSVITNEDGWYKKGLTNILLRPEFAILNPKLTFTLPAYQTACGASDMLAHVMERYFTNVKAVELTNRLCEATMKTIVKEAPKLMDDPENYDVRSEIMWAGTVAHNDILDTGRVGDWSSHGIEHEISGIYDVAHGAGLSIVFPAWMKYVYKHDINLFARFANRVFDVEYRFDDPERTVLEGIASLERFYKTMNLPTRLSDIDVDASRIDEMAKKATNSNAHTIGNFVSLDQEAIISILKLAL